MNKHNIFTIQVKDRNYNEFCIIDSNNQNVDPNIIDPINTKLFNGDKFIINDNKIKIIDSPIKNNLIPGVLILKNSKTYGRKDGDGKLYYKFLPKDPTLPSFLVPYEIKYIGFSKVLINIYIVINFKDWDGKHPHGFVNQVIGPVNLLEHFYEYQLYCKNLNCSIQKFKQATSKNINDIDHDLLINEVIKSKNIEDRTNIKTFTIDPEGSLDFDDGFSIQKIYDKYLISIYIANVPILLDHLNLWDHFTKRVSTIYLPNKKLPMLPNILSDTLCSLQENKKRLTFHLDIIINNKNEIESTNYGISVIKCYKNFRYEENSLLKLNEYNILLNLCKNLPEKYLEINNSHDLVAYLMILMNYYISKSLLEKKIGIFRSSIIKKENKLPENLSPDLLNFLKIFNSTSGQYLDINKIDNNSSLRHDLLNLNAYIHITSPIRRLVDLLNMLILQKDILSENAFEFYKNWINNIDLININMKSIRKLQNECTLLELCTNNNQLMETTYSGWIIGKKYFENNVISYNVYLPKLKLTSYVKLTEEYNVYDNLNFKLYLFTDEDNLKRKIRLAVIIS